MPAPASSGRVVSLINLKGGVGKTTLAVGLAWQLAADSKVLLVDIDPQFNATQWLVATQVYIDWVQDKTKRTVFDVFQPDEAAPGAIGGFRAPRKRPPPTLANCVIDVTHSGTVLSILPSTLELIMLDAAPRGTENRLKGFLDIARKSYDYILIDCPPTASLFSFSAYLASDAYLVPIKPDPLSVLGLPLLERTIQDYESRSAHSIKRLGLVLTMVRQTDAMRTTVQQIRENYSGEVFAKTLQQTTGVAEAVAQGLPLQEFTKTKHSLRPVLLGLRDEFLKRVAAL